MNERLSELDQDHTPYIQFILKLVHWKELNLRSENGDLEAAKELKTEIESFVIEEVFEGRMRHLGKLVERTVYMPHLVRNLLLEELSCYRTSELSSSQSRA